VSSFFLNPYNSNALVSMSTSVFLVVLNLISSVQVECIANNSRWNETAWNATNTTTTPLPSSSRTTPVAPLPDEGEVEKEHHYSMTIFFILLVLGEVNYLQCCYGLPSVL